jgi:hypothetical protein
MRWINESDLVERGNKSLRLFIFDKLVAYLRATPAGPDNATVFHGYIEQRIQDLWGSDLTVDREVKIKRGPDKWGRLDLVVSESECGFQAAIEIDWLKPRFRSLAKLRNFDGYWVVILRTGEPWLYRLDGIDAVISIPAVDPVKTFMEARAG